MEQIETMDGVAIIGMALRFPGAASPDQFWQNLCDGVESVRFYSPTELLQQAGADGAALLENPNFVPAAATVDDVEWFDADFFGFSPREAGLTDPQQRLLLECAWEAIESAGYNPLQTPGATGIFASCAISTYLDYGSLFGNLAKGFYPTFIGNAQDYATSRIAYKLNLRGPSITLMTACSSSLIAVHLACQSILNGECDMALAGGASIRLTDYPGYYYQEGGTASPDGHCRAFDAQSQGCVFGNGLGLVLLKSLDAALADGDHIYAVVRGSATNNDGADKMGFTAPSIAGQAAVVAEAMAVAEVEPEDISYIEAHGTGTAIGDPIEIAALTQVFRETTDRKQFCGIGSVKTNIGHLDVAAGVANLIKATLALEHKVLPATLHFQQPNPKLNLAETPFYINAQSQPWATAALPRRAGVSSFGLGGTNAHLILEEAPQADQTDQPDARPHHLLTLNAKDDAALHALAARYADFLATAADTDLADICYTTHMGRAHFAHRLALSGASCAELRAQCAATQTTAAEQPQIAPRIAFLFTGQGAQYLEMGRELYATEATFRATLDECDRLLQVQLGESVLAILYPSAPANGRDPAALIDQTIYTQPALFMLEYALAQLWQSWGVQPDFLIGHSIGEIVAACVAGIFSLEDALKLIAARGQLMNALPQDGAMVSLLADEARVKQAIAAHRQEVSIAAVNGPESIVIAGKREQVLAIAAALAAEGVKTRELAVSHAFHSPLMEPMLDDFAQVAQSITYHQAKIPIVSNITGNLSTDPLSTVSLSHWQYWVRHVRETVRFADGIATLHEQGVNILLEIGPKPTLLGMAGQVLDKTTDDKMTGEHPVIRREPHGRGHPVIQSSGHPVTPSSPHPLMLPSLRDNRPDWQQMVESLGALYVRGVEVAWRAFEQSNQGDRSPRRLPLPTYPFQRQRYWLKQPTSRQQQARLRPQIDTMIKLPAQRQIVFEAKCGLATQPYVVDHRVHDVIVISGAAHLSMVLTGVELAYGDQPCRLENIVFLHALSLDEHEVRTVQLLFDEAENGSRIDFQVLSYNEQVSDAPLLHATGQLITDAAARPRLPLADLQASCTEPIDPARVVNILAEQVRVDLGPSYLWGEAFWRGKAGVLSKLRLPETEHSIEGYPLFPGLFDACMQGIIAYHADETLDPAVPFAIDSFTFYGGGDLRELWCHAEAVAEDRWNLHLADAHGRTILRCEGLLRRAFPQSAAASQQMQSQWLYQMHWQPEPLPAAPPAQSAPPRLWLLMDNHAQATNTLQTTLQTQGEQVVRIHLDPSADPASFNIGSNGHLPATVTVHPQGDYQPLFAALFDKAALHHAGQLAGFNLLYLSGNGDGAEGQNENCTPVEALQLSGTLLQTVQALSQSGIDTRLWIITEGCQGVADTVAETPEAHGESTQAIGRMAAQGALWGLGRTIAREYPQLHCTAVDLLPTASPAEMAEQIMHECQQTAHSSGVEGQIIYRAEGRAVARLASCRPPEKSATCEPDASYLITGGLGALGLQSAQMLVEAGARHLILASRRTTLDAPTQATIATLQEQGATIQIIAADVADATDVATLVAACTAVAPLRGIIHAAGTVDDGILAQQSWARLAAVMQAKVDGTWQLHLATQQLPLDFFICFSSVSALFGNQGQGNYAAANAFMDALMVQRQQQGLPGLSLAWGPWAEVGMAARQQAQMQHSIMQPMAPEQGRAILAQLLFQQAPYVAIVPVAEALPVGNIGSIALQRRPGTMGKVTAKHGGNAGTQETLRQQLVAAADGERLPLLLDHLRQVVANALGIATASQIDAEAGFFTLGLDSLMSLEVRNRLETGVEAPLRATLLFDYPSIDALASYLLHDVLKLDADAAGESNKQPEQNHALTFNGLDLATADVVETDLDALSGSDLIALIAQKAEDLL